MTVMRGRVPVVFIWLILGWSEYFSGRRTCDGAEAASGCADDVVAGNHRLKSLALYVNAVPGPVHLCPVPGEDVADPPAGIDLVDLIAVLDAVGPGIVLDGPVVALDVDPPGGGRLDHAGTVELVADDLAGGRSFFDVDVLRGGVRDVIVDEHIVVASVRLAAGLPAPVLVRGPHIGSRRPGGPVPAHDGERLTGGAGERQVAAPRDDRREAAACAVHVQRIQRG